MKIRVNAYLAGPDVFFPNAKELGESKKRKLQEVGIVGYHPFDNEIPKETFENPLLAAQTIAEANEQMMLDCCKEGEIGIILFNMSPFHKSPSADVGTCFEVGFMSALLKLKKNVIIIGYTNDPRCFKDRVVDIVYGGIENTTEEDGRLCGSDGNTIESFGGEENLMITSAVKRTGARVVGSFEEAVTLAVELAEAKIKELLTPKAHVMASVGEGRWQTSSHPENASGYSYGK